MFCSCCFFRKFISFFLCLKFTAINLLFTAIFILCHNTLYTNKLRESFNWMLIFLISLFSLFFCQCLCCNLSCRMIRAMRCLSLMLVPLVAYRIFANLVIKCSTLHIFRNLISRRVLSYLVLMFSKVLTTVYMSFPCFFLMNINMMIREYNLTINNNNQKLFISVQTENNNNNNDKKQDLKFLY